MLTNIGNSFYLRYLFTGILTVKFLISFLFIANGQTTFEKAFKYGDSGVSACKFGNGYYAIGADGHSLLYLYKLNIDGDSIWRKSYGITGTIDGTSGRDIMITSDSNIIIVGKKWLSSIYLNMYVLMVDTNGNIIWELEIDKNVELAGQAVSETPDGHFIVCGNMYNPGTRYDILIAKISPSGNKIWEKIFDFNFDDYSYDIAIISDTRYVINGHEGDFSVGMDVNANVFMLDSSGFLLWHKSLGDTNDNSLNAMSLTNDSNLILAGYTVDPINQTRDVWLIKLDLNGDTIWSRIYLKPNFYEYIYSICALDSVFILGGRTEINILRNSYILVADTAGNFLWENEYVNGESFENIFYDVSDNSIVASGKADSFGSLRLYFVKLTSSGVLNSPGLLSSDIAEVQLYPNPTTGNIYILSKLSENVKFVSVAIYSPAGMPVCFRDLSLNSNLYEINISDLPAGVYCVRIRISFGQSEFLINKVLIKI